MTNVPLSRHVAYDDPPRLGVVQQQPKARRVNSLSVRPVQRSVRPVAQQPGPVARQQA
jgi:hypothetical protein